MIRLSKEYRIIHQISKTADGQIVCILCQILCPEGDNVLRLGCTRDVCQDWIRIKPHTPDHFHVHSFSHNAARTIDRENRKNKAKYIKWMSCLDFNILDIVTE